MSNVITQINMSVDGYVTGPADGPGCGLGVGGERLHYWVFGGPWSYDAEPTGGAIGVDKEFLDASFARLGAVVGGRATFEAAGAWGGNNPWDVPFFILTHRTDDAPPGFTFVDGFATTSPRSSNGSRSMHCGRPGRRTCATAWSDGRRAPSRASAPPPRGPRARRLARPA